MKCIKLYKKIEESLQVKVQKEKQLLKEVNTLKLHIAINQEKKKRSVCSTTKSFVKKSYLSSVLPRCSMLSTDIVEYSLDKNIIGEGTFGVVVKGSHYLGFDVAVKCLKKSHFNDYELLEVRVMQKLSGSRHFPCLFGIISNNLTHDIVMELCLFDGNVQTLKSEIKRPLALTEGNICITVGIEICKGMHYMHKQHLLHNDIKEDNILLVRKHNMISCKISDFGKVTHIKETITYSLSQKERDVYNERHLHLAYELRNASNVKQSVATDIYSIGRVLLNISILHNVSVMAELGKSMLSITQLDRPKLDNAIQLLTDYQGSQSS